MLRPADLRLALDFIARGIDDMSGMFDTHDDYSAEDRRQGEVDLQRGHALLARMRQVERYLGDTFVPEVNAPPEGIPVTLADLAPGDILRADAGFTCLTPDAALVVERDDTKPGGALYVLCDDGRHDLDGQVAFTPSKTLVGLRRIGRMVAPSAPVADTAAGGA